MMERFGYVAGVGIACATVTLAIYTGMMYERYTAPEPCIANFASTWKVIGLVEKKLNLKQDL